ncbi:hypothetical protein MPTK1_4g23220 [Marchantia polymorpha subsp. ruderalis]|uniref:Uncharacterized protein n=2 Tax=Marchantia polymorpha TaxID=3197 RepID=A0AAF6BCW7_MARPO|nr:hypothetical protein MARPO_0020s0086 [Marchantia polymorpha]BBN09851.1 hypothetical protein Mp_4g23220 [Marchantia polymorpha subsp. ruderalis]|eukprot:PTQ44429.1 hypothetical protein MARPO_0020s0086 [Marchantia polymorpha]
MKTSLRRLCALFPWSSITGPDSCKQRGLYMATELRGLGDLACFEREQPAYTSLRDIIPPERRKRSYMNFLEIEEPAFWLNDNPNRTPKTRLLEKAAHVWLQSSVAERNQQQGNIFTRCWLKFTRQTSVSTTMTPPRNTFRFTFADCVGYCPILKWFDLSHAFSALVNRLRQPQAFVSLRQ